MRSHSHADYALAHAELAHAHLWTFQASRVSSRPGSDGAGAAITRAAPSTWIRNWPKGTPPSAFLLASAGRPARGRRGRARGTALEPANWRHQFRLGVAAWEDERLDAFEAVLAVYPRLAYAYFGIAMVYVARRDLVAAERILRAGIAQSPATIEPGFRGAACTGSSASCGSPWGM